MHTPHLTVQENTIGIISKFPFVENSTIEIKGTGYPRISGVRVLVNFHGEYLAVYSFHPTRPEVVVRPTAFKDEDLEASYAALLKQLAQEPYPIVLLCDCNITETNNPYSQIENVLVDAWRERGWGFGMTATANLPFPVFRSDLVWVSEDFYIQDVGIWPSNGQSDHFPVWTELYRITQE